MKKLSTALAISLGAILCNAGSVNAQISFSSDYLGPACAPQTITFVNTTTDTNAWRYDWDFGDGSPTVIDTLTDTIIHTYTNGGSFWVWLLVYDDTLGFIGDTSMQIDVSGSQGAFSTPDSACPGDLVMVNSWDNASSFEWDFGDGFTSSTQWGNEIHTYSAPGTYDIKLIQNTYDCGYDTIIQTIVISGSVSANAEMFFQPDPACPGEPVHIYMFSPAASWSWDFGDGDTANLRDNKHSYDTAGSYYVTLTATNGCGFSKTITDTIVIDTNIAIPNWISFNTKSPACPGERVDLYIDGGYASYVWDYGDGSPIVTKTDNWNSFHIFNDTGTFVVSVTVTNYCGKDTTLVDTVVINNNVPIPNSVNAWSSQDTACPGDAIFLGTDQGFAAYLWNFGDGDSAMGPEWAVHTYDSIGNFTTSVTLINYCGLDTTLFGTITVTNTAGFPQGLALDIFPNPVCPGDIVTLSSDDGYQLHLWNFGDGDSTMTTGSQIQHQYASVGNYPVLIGLINGCNDTTTLFDTIVVNMNGTIPPAGLFSFPFSSACPGDEVHFLVEFQMQNGGGGDPPPNNYTYSWDFGDGITDTTVGVGASHVYTNTGSYTTTVTIINGCGNSAAYTLPINIDTNSIPVLAGQGDLWGIPGESAIAGCPGDAILFFMAGTGNNTWDFGDSTAGVATEVLMTPMGILVTIIKHVYADTGTYLVKLTLTNACGNSVTDSMYITIGDNQLADAGMFVESPLSADGYTTCQNIKFVAIGGAAFLWNFGDGDTIITSSPTINHVYSTPDNYLVTVSMINGCGNVAVFSAAITVSGVSGAALTVIPAATTCNGGSDGSATVTITNGSPPYTYLWDDPSQQTNDTAVNLSAGTYSVTVTEENGCSTTASAIIIIEPAGMTLTTGSVDANCGSSDGSAFVTATGGVSPYTYAWSSGGTNLIENNLVAGTYMVTVTDFDGCSQSAAVSINESGAGTVSVNTVTGITCNGGLNGSIDIAVSNGTPPITYSWSNGDTTEDISNLTAGTYEVTVTDSAGCNAFESITIIEPDGMNITTSSTDANCGSSDGSVTVNVTGGIAPYSYSWNTGDTTTAVTNLSSGSYLVTITDANGCVDSVAATVSNVGAPTITVNATDLSCNGSADGAVTLNVTGGSTPYSYWWSTGSTVQNQTNMIAFTYFVTVTDASGCETTLSIVVDEPDPLSLTVTGIDVTGCGISNGSAAANVNGGTSPYSYTWSTLDITQTISGQPEGVYSVTVSDANGCPAITDSVTVGLTVTGQDICLVSLDSATNKYLVVWEKTAGPNSYNIYRESAITGVYDSIGNVPYASLSTFVDAGSSPATKSDLYKISAVDLCNNKSAKSAHHRTMHLNVNLGIGVINLGWDNYQGFSFGSYIIWRGDSTGINPLDTISTSFNTYTDTLPPAGDSLYYQIEVIHPTGCTPALAKVLTYNSAKSNVSNRLLPTGITEGGTSLRPVQVYPNPNRGVFTLSTNYEFNTNLRIVVYDVLGRVAWSVGSENIAMGNNEIEIDMSNHPAGIYHLQIITDKGISNTKIIIE
ncbi:MAG: PKD domain-containing protein [Cytophagales bacterium]|nr:PKD domain-containing protein [Cytophagales bacterium]